MSFDSEITKSAEQVLDLCKAKGLMVSTVESCTGGLIIGALTEIAGSSAVVDRGFITYTNEAKHAMVGVPEEMLTTYGAVSEEVARAMAEGGLARSNAHITVSVTGIAGPGGGSDEKQVGTVHMACAGIGKVTRHQHQSYGDLGRAGIRGQTILDALDMVLEMANADQA